jgi:hypothetical protein
MTGPPRPLTNWIDNRKSSKSFRPEVAVASMCPQSEHTSCTKKEKQGMALKHGISGSNRFVIKKLEEQLRSKQQRCEEAERVNRELRAKEQVQSLLRRAIHTICFFSSPVAAACGSCQASWQFPHLVHCQSCCLGTLYLGACIIATVLPATAQHPRILWLLSCSCNFQLLQQSCIHCMVLQVLLENIAAQGETLHFVALAALQQPDLSENGQDDQDCTMASMARCLMEDVKVRTCVLGTRMCAASFIPQTAAVRISHMRSCRTQRCTSIFMACSPAACAPVEPNLRSCCKILLQLRRWNQRHAS